MEKDLEEVSLADMPNDCIRRSRVFQQAIAGASVRVSKSSLAISAKFDYFRELSLALLVRTMLCKKGQKGSPTRPLGDTISLITTYVQGVNCTKDLIIGGYHSKAAAVLKQDYEMLARVREIAVGKAKAGVTPNARHAPEGSQRIYSGLNDLAHPSNEGLMLSHLSRLNQDGINGVNPFPTFVKQTIEAHYWTHVWLTFEFCREGVKLLADNYGWADPHVADCVTRWGLVEDQGILCGLLSLKSQL